MHAGKPVPSLGKFGRHEGNLGLRLAARKILLGVRDGIGRRAHFEQAGGAKPGQRAGGERRAALRALVGIGHWRVYFYGVHARFRSKTGGTLPEKLKKHSTLNIQRRTSKGFGRRFIGRSRLNVER